MSEDTSPETPLAKSTSEPRLALDDWRRPGGHDASKVNSALIDGLPANGAHFAWTFGSDKVRAFQARGALGFVLAMMVLIGMGALIALFFVVAMGVGTVLALGAGAAAVLGLGANMLRRRLTNARSPELGPGNS